MPRLALLVLALAAALATGPAAAQEARRLSVTGTGVVASPPDMAVLRLGVEGRARRASEALAEVSEAAAAVLEALRAAGVAEADIQTSSLGLGARYDDGRSEAGFEASNVVTARIRDLEALGGVIDAATEAGANRIAGLAFTLADRSAALEEARRRAVADATGAAEALADAAGVPLGPVLRIDARAGGRPPFEPSPMDGMMRAEAVSVPISAGEIDTRAEVEMVFALEAPGGGSE